MPTLDFKGKQLIYAHHLSVPSRTLEIDAKKSLSAMGQKPSLDDNLIIHGDNRRFILVECEHEIVDKIIAERVRRVIKRVSKAKDDNLKNGLGGSFAYCTLGDEISIEKMLTGKHLPDYETLARHLVYTASGQSPNKIRKAKGKDGFFHETADRLFYLIYEPNLDFLRSAGSALNSIRAERIAKQAKTKNKTAVVFATHKFIGQKELTAMGIVFCGLPYGKLG